MQSVLAPTYGLVNERISVMFTVQNHLPREVKTTVNVLRTRGATATKPVVLPPMARSGQPRLHPANRGEGDYIVRLAVEQEESFRGTRALPFHRGRGRRC